MHDPRVGRFFAVDPLAAEYPHNSVYAFSENRVIDMIELEGLEMSFSGAPGGLGFIAGSIEQEVVNFFSIFKETNTKAETKVTIGPRIAFEVKNGVGFDINAGSVDLISLKSENSKSTFDYLGKDNDVFTAGLEVAIPTPIGSFTNGVNYENSWSDVTKQLNGEKASNGKFSTVSTYGEFGIGAGIKTDTDLDKSKTTVSGSSGGGFKIGLFFVWETAMEVTQKIEEENYGKN